MRRDRRTYWLLLLGQLLLVLWLLLAVADAALLDDAYHMHLHAEQRAAQATGLTDDGVARVTAAINAYLRGDRGDLMLTESVYGVSQPVFNARELLHMEDVKALFTAGRRIEMGALLAAFLLTAFYLMRTRSRIAALGRTQADADLAARGLRTRSRIAMLGRALTIAAALWLGICALAAIACIADFSAVFLAFHGLLFKNDLWLMNPETDLMIRLLPEQFFVAVGARVVLCWGAILAGLIALGLGVTKIAARRGGTR